MWVQVSGGKGWWLCGYRGMWRSLVLVALEWLCMRVWVDWTPWAEMMVSLGVLGV